MSIFNSPGVKTSIQNYSGYVAQSSTCVVGMVGAASKGPLNQPTLITSEGQYVATFGSPSTTNYGQICAVHYLQQGNQLYYVRVSDGTDAVATINVPSTVSTPVTSFTVNGAYSGAGYNGYQIVISNVNQTVTPATFTFQLLDSNNRSVLILNGATLVSTSSMYLPTLVNNNGYPVSVNDPNNGSGSIPKAGTYVLVGGKNGDTSITDAQVMGTQSDNTGLSAFYNNDLYPITLLATPGFTSQAIISASENLCSNRGDCLYICDTPQGLSVSNVLDWSNGTGSYSATMSAINSQYVAVYWPWCQVYDPYNAQSRWVPPSGLICGQFAYNDNVGYPWNAPAGINRGLLTIPSAIEYSASQGDRDSLQGNGNVINPIIKMTNIGFVIWGQATTLRQASDLNRVNVVRLVALIRTAIAKASLQIVFENNNQLTWNEWLGIVRPYLTQIQNEGGFYSFKATMDSSIVTNYDIQTHYLPGKVQIQPQLDAEDIDIGFILIPTGAQFV